METHTLEPANEALVAEHADVVGSLVLDVRRAGAFQQATTHLPGATWHDPATVAQWAASVPRDRRVTVYCVHGHEVSRDTALHLRAAGVDARYLRGGIEGWREAGMPVVPKRNLP